MVGLLPFLAEAAVEGAVEGVQSGLPAVAPPPAAAPQRVRELGQAVVRGGLGRGGGDRPQVFGDRGPVAAAGGAEAVRAAGARSEVWVTACGHVAAIASGSPVSRRRR